MLDDILEFIVEVICEIAVMSDNKRNHVAIIKFVGGVILGILFCISALLIYNGVSNNSVLLIISGIALLIVLMIVSLAIIKYKRNKQ